MLICPSVPRLTGSVILPPMTAMLSAPEMARVTVHVALTLGAAATAEDEPGAPGAPAAPTPPVFRIARSAMMFYAEGIVIPYVP